MDTRVVRMHVPRPMIGVIVAVASAPPVLGQTVTYTDVAPAAGMVVAHNPASNFLLSPLNLARMTAGGAVADFNNDGRQDIYVIGGGAARDQLYLNNGNGTFTDVATAWGLTSLHMGLGAAAGDFNGDGWIDLYVTSLGPASQQPQTGVHRLYRNNSGTGFTNVGSAARVNRTSTNLPDGMGAAFGDYDLDGDLDLMVTGWITNSGGNRLFRNNGDGTFADVTLAAGVQDLAVRGFGPRFADMNGDRYPELLLTADFETSRYYVNRQDGTFFNRTIPGGLGLDDNGMGSALGDFDGDGRLDWYVTSIYTLSPIAGVPGTGSMLYMNLGDDMYAERSVTTGVNQGGWGWGTQAVDIDHDGDEDLVATNGWHQTNGAGVAEWLNDPTCAFQNDGTGVFTSIGVACGLAAHTAQGRGLFTVDYDNDGDLDVVILSLQETPRLFRSNVVTPKGTPADARWLRVFLDTSRSNRRVAPNGYGARVIAASVDGGGVTRTQTRYLSPGSTYLGQSEASAHFGLADAPSVTLLTVEWPDGRRVQIPNVSVNQTITVRYCPTDLSENGVADSTDFFEFLVAFFNESPTADFNRTGTVTSQDFFDFLAAFFEGC